MIRNGKLKLRIEHVYPLEQAAQALRAYGVKVAAIPADVAKAEEVQKVIDATLAALGRIDILVDNAGTAWIDHTLTTTDEQWQYCMEINLFSAVRFTRAVAPRRPEPDSPSGPC